MLFVVVDRRSVFGPPEANVTWSFELSGLRLKVAELERFDVHWQPQLLDVAGEVHSHLPRCTIDRSLDSLCLLVLLPLQLDWSVPESCQTFVGTVLRLERPSSDGDPTSAGTSSPPSDSGHPFASFRIHFVDLC